MFEHVFTKGSQGVQSVQDGGRLPWLSDSGVDIVVKTQRVSSRGATRNESRGVRVVRLCCGHSLEGRLSHELRRGIFVVRVGMVEIKMVDGERVGIEWAEVEKTVNLLRSGA